MPDHTCTKEAEITRILMLTEQQATQLTRIDRALNGNGRPGIITEVDRNTQFRKAALWIAGAAFVQTVGNIGMLIKILVSGNG